MGGFGSGFCGVVSYFSFTICRAFWLTSSLRFRAFAMPSSVLSSKVGPSPPVVMMNFGFRLSVSWISFAISSTSSDTRFPNQ